MRLFGGKTLSYFPTLRRPKGKLEITAPSQPPGFLCSVVREAGSCANMPPYRTAARFPGSSAVEQVTVHHKVGGSNPPRGATASPSILTFSPPGPILPIGQSSARTGYRPSRFKRAGSETIPPVLFLVPGGTLHRGAARSKHAAPVVSSVGLLPRWGISEGVLLLAAVRALVVPRREAEVFQVAVDGGSRFLVDLAEAVHAVAACAEPTQEGSKALTHPEYVELRRRESRRTRAHRQVRLSPEFLGRRGDLWAGRVMERFHGQSRQSPASERNLSSRLGWLGRAISTRKVA